MVRHNRHIRDWQDEVNWINQGARRKSGHWAIVTCVFGMLIYTVCRDMNMLRFQEGMVTTDIICSEIAIHIHTRGRTIQHWQGTIKQLNSFP